MKINTRCQYCDTNNPPGRKDCLACGAPLPEPTQSQAHFKPGSGEGLIHSQDVHLRENETVATMRKAGEKIEEFTIKGYYFYALLWRTLGETLVIGITAFVIGLAGGGTGMSIMGVIGAVIYGVVVGSIIKSFYGMLLSMLAGLVSGLILGAAVYILLPHLPLSVLVLAVTSITAVCIGSRRLPASSKNWWEKLRPFLGGLGGLIFAVLGTSIGWGLSEIIKAFLK